MRQPVSVFFSYAHEDEALCDELARHLSLLQRQEVISAWHDRNITAGSVWEPQLKQQLEAAQLILLLISADFLNSDYCYDIEMKGALQRHDKGEAWVIPIHVRPVDWQDAEFSRLQALPTDTRPVTAWKNRDEALKNIAQGIRRAARAIQHTPEAAPIAYRTLDELKAALRYQQRGVELLDNLQVAPQAKNQAAWYFTLGEQHLSLDTLERKQCLRIAAWRRRYGRCISRKKQSGTGSAPAGWTAMNRLSRHGWRRRANSKVARLRLQRQAYRQ